MRHALPLRYSFFRIALIFLALLQLAAGQSGHSLRGRLLGAKQQPLTGLQATVTLLQASDSARLQQTLSDRTGGFGFAQVPAGRYRVSVTAVGYSTLYSPVFELGAAQPSLDLAPLVLAPLPKAMTGVTVTARKPPIEQKIDRTVVNVDASVTSAGATALEVLEKAPGVTVDKEGNISVKGKEGVLVLIDGRPSQLSGADLAALLQSMNAASLEQVEIMTNPPARFDAAGNAGIINLRLKKTRQAGYNGTATLSYAQGRYPKTQTSFNGNYRRGKVNFFANGSHSYRRGFELMTLQRTLRDPGTSAIGHYFDQRSDKVMSGRSANGRIGLDYAPAARTSLGFGLSGYNSISGMYNRNRSDIATATKELESITRATVDQSGSWKSGSANLYFRHQFDSAGRELTADVDAMRFRSALGQLMINSYYDAQGAAIGLADTLASSLPQTIDIHSGRVDYLHPLGKDMRLEAGLKSSLVSTDNDAVFDSLQGGARVRDRGRSNHFRYREQINAAYANYSAPLSKKWSAQLGLRFEHTYAQGRQLTTGQGFERRYAQLFPTAFLQYKPVDKHVWGLNYGRRIRRPSYQSLNPFIRFMDRYTYSQGNPDLKPQLSHNIELSHSYRNLLTTTLNYTLTTDMLQQVIEQQGQEAFARIINFARQRQYGLSVNATTNINKWWTGNVYVHLFHNRFHGLVSDVPVTAGVTRFAINGTQQFKLSKTLSAELSGMYRSGGLQGVVRMKGRGGLSAGFSQQLLRNKGTLRLTMRDLLYSQYVQAFIDYGNVDAAFQERGDSRVVQLSFSYRFSKGKAGGQRRRTSGSAQEEQNRVGVE